MPRLSLLASEFRKHTWSIPAVTGALVALLALNPAPLLPVAGAYRALCEEYPLLALVTFHAPALPLALLLLLGALALLAGAWAALSGWAHAHRFNRCVQRGSAPLPPHVLRVAADLGIADRLTYLPWEKPAACCYGFIRPRIAITAALVSQMDEEELTAVLAHERQHLFRRDPLRYLFLHALTAAAFMFPVAHALKRRQEARIELAADRAALAVASPGALAGALLTVLNATPVHVPGAAWLTATETRIAHLSGRHIMPGVPKRLTISSIGLAVIIAVTTINLAASADVVQIMCVLCTGDS